MPQDKPFSYDGSAPRDLTWAGRLRSFISGFRLARGDTSAEPAGHPMPSSAAEVRQHHVSVSAGGNLRAAVFGVNDGLVSNTGLILGVAGATVDVHTIIVGGVAGLMAGACSMAAGEYVSVRSQCELYEKLIRRERDEIARYPRQETEEIALIYSERGLPLTKARDLAKKLMRDPKHAVEVHAREELGLNPQDLGSPWGAAASSFVAFAFGAAIPLLPLLMWPHVAHVIPISAALAGSVLFATGALVNRLTGQRAMWGGVRMLLIGGAAGAVTYFIGSLFAGPVN